MHYWIWLSETEYRCFPTYTASLTKGYGCLKISNVFRIYDRFKLDYVAHGAFLECLEPYILSNRLTVISPEVMQSFVEHFQAKSKLVT